MNQQQPSSKVKKWFLISLAFVIALIVFTIARVIFTAMNGGVMNGKLEVGGILLFYGVYSLLSGLFLNNSSAKKRGAWILAIYLIVSIVFTYYMNNSKFGLENQIMRMNQNTPTRIDDQTELLSTKLNGNNVDIKYRLFNYASSDIPSENSSQLKSQIKQEFCKDSDYQKIMKYKNGINVYFYGKHGSQIIDLYLTQDICSISDNTTKDKTNLLAKQYQSEKQTIFSTPTIPSERTASEYFNKAVSYYDDNHKTANPDAVIELLNKAISLDSNYELAYSLLGGVYLENKKEYEKSIYYYSKAIEINSIKPNWYRWRGQAYLKQDEYEKSISDFNKAIDLNPEYAEAYGGRGIALIKSKINEKKGCEDVKKFIDLDPVNGLTLMYGLQVKLGLCK